MLKKKIEVPTTLGAIVQGVGISDPDMMEKVTTIEVINNFGSGGKEVYVPCQEDLGSVPVGEGAIVALKLDCRPIGGIGFFD